MLVLDTQHNHSGITYQVAVMWRYNYNYDIQLRTKQFIQHPSVFTQHREGFNSSHCTCVDIHTCMYSFWENLHAGGQWHISKQTDNLITQCLS